MSTISFNDLPAAITEILERVNNIERHLRAADEVNGKANNQLLTITEAGQLLGLSVNTLYKLVQSKKIPYSKRSKRLYFLKDELLTWIKDGRKLTENELKIAAELGIIQANKKDRHGK